MLAARRQDAAAAAALLAFCALLYGMTLAAPVFYDDLSHVQNGPLLGKGWGDVWRALVSTRYFELAQERTYQPLVTLLHWLTGPRPWLYRSAGLALHALNGWLVFRLGRRLSGTRAGWLAAFLFCAYPPSTEAVFFASFKGHLLAAAGALLTLEAWLDHLDDGRRRSLLRAAAWYALTLACKETGLAAAVLCGAAWLCRGRPRRYAGLAALAAASAAYLALRFGLLAAPPSFGEPFARPSAASLGWYARALVWPAPLCLEHSPSFGRWAWLPAAGLAAALAACRRRPVRLFFALWIPAALLPFLHAVPFANLSPVADRYLYLASAGWALLLADALAAGGGALALGALLAVWGGMTAARNGLFRDERGFFEQTAACAPDNPRAHYLCGLARLKDQDPRGAAVSFARALELRDSPGIRKMLELSLKASGRKCSSSDCR